MWSFSRLWQEVEPFYDAFRSSLRVSKHLVALTATNRVETVRILYALLEAKIPTVLLHPRLTVNEHLYCLSDSVPDVLIWDNQLGVAPPYVAACARDYSLPRGTAFVVYTSGTSGRPKGAILTRKNLVMSAKSSATNLGFEPRDRWGCCLPICHVGGLSVLTRCLIARKPVVLMERFRSETVVDAIQRDGVTLLSLVPAMLTLLLQNGHQKPLRMLRAVLLGGAPTPDKLLEECVKLKIKALPTYGMTEVCSQIATWSPAEPVPLPVRQVGCGRPLPGIEVRIAGNESEGEIQVRGPMVFKGYLRQPRRSSRDWFATGDVGRWDGSNRLIVLARRADLILVGGENVYPAEVEQTLSDCLGVKTLMVYGIPDPVLGQVVAADVVFDDHFDMDEFRRYSEQTLAKYKRPQKVRLVHELPVGTTGKPIRPR